MNPAERDALLSRLCGQVWPFGPLLDALPVPPDARVLDIGGGEGGLLAALRERGFRGAYHNADLLHGADAHALPFPDAAFGAVFMVRVLAHLRAPDLALAEAWRVLAPGGRLVVAAHGPRHLEGLLGAGSAEPPAFLWPGARSFILTVPVRLSAADGLSVAASYGLTVQPTEDLHSVLQLAGWTEKTGAP